MMEFFDKAAKVYMVGNKKVALYSIGVLANAIDRQQQTVRKWEKRGVIPPAQYRSETGRRLYTKQQVDIVKRLVNKYGIKQGQKIPDAFIDEIYREFKDIPE